jgi:hypothetical protein
MRDRVFYIICFGFFTWSAVALFCFCGFIFSNFTWGNFFCFIFVFYTNFRENNLGILISIFAFAFCFGIFRFNMVDVPNPTVLENQVGQKVFLSGEIVDEPSIKENNQQLTVEIKNRTQILLSTGLETDYKYGDEINFTGTFEKAREFCD